MILAKRILFSVSLSSAILFYLLLLFFLFRALNFLYFLVFLTLYAHLNSAFIYSILAESKASER